MPPTTSRSASARRPTRWRRAPASPSRWVWTWTRSAPSPSRSRPQTRTAPPTPTTRASLRASPSRAAIPPRRSPSPPPTTPSTTTTSGSSLPSGRCPRESRPGPPARRWSRSPTTTPLTTSRSASGRRPTRWRRAPASPSRWVWTWTRSAPSPSRSRPRTRTAPATPITAVFPPTSPSTPGSPRRRFTFAATDDAIDDDGERVKLAFGTLPTGITAGTTDETVVSITDDDAPGAVKVSFGVDPRWPEGAGVTVTVGLDVDPERSRSRPPTRTAPRLHRPANVTIDSGDLEELHLRRHRRRHRRRRRAGQAGLRDAAHGSHGRDHQRDGGLDHRRRRP